MAKNTRVCRYVCCPVPDNQIDIDSDEYVAYGRKYYHKTCYEHEKMEQEKRALLNADIACILDLWQKHISNTVNFGYLRKILNEYLERGISSDYMLFTMQYVVSHRLPLRYPPGFRYMLDMQEIKDAYQKQQAKKLLNQQNAAAPPKQTNAPQFALNRKKSGGFETIFDK